MHSFQSLSTTQSDFIPGAATIKISTQPLSQSDAHLNHKPRINEQLCAEVNEVVAECVGYDPMHVNWVSAFLVWHALVPARSDSSVDIAKKVWTELFTMAMAEHLYAPRQVSRQFMKRFVSRLEDRNLSIAALRVRVALLMEIFETLVQVGMVGSNPVFHV